MARIYYNVDVQSHPAAGLLEIHAAILADAASDLPDGYVLTAKAIGTLGITDAIVNKDGGIATVFNGFPVTIDSRKVGHQKELERVRRIFKPHAFRDRGILCTENEFYRTAMNMSNFFYDERAVGLKGSINTGKAQVIASWNRYQANRKNMIQARINHREFQDLISFLESNQYPRIPINVTTNATYFHNVLQNCYKTRREQRKNLCYYIEQYRKLLEEDKKRNDGKMKSIRIARKRWARDYERIQGCIDKGIVESVSVDVAKGIFHFTYAPIVVNRRNTGPVCAESGSKNCDCMKMEEELYYIGRVRASVHSREVHEGAYPKNACQYFKLQGLSYAPGQWHHPHSISGECGATCLKTFAELMLKVVPNCDIFTTCMTIYEFLSSYNAHSVQAVEHKRTHMLLRAGGREYKPRTIEPVEYPLLAVKKEADTKIAEKVGESVNPA